MRSKGLQTHLQLSKYGKKMSKSNRILISGVSSRDLQGNRPARDCHQSCCCRPSSSELEGIQEERKTKPTIVSPWLHRHSPKGRLSCQLCSLSSHLPLFTSPSCLLSPRSSGAFSMTSKRKNKSLRMDSWLRLREAAWKNKLMKRQSLGKQTFKENSCVGCNNMKGILYSLRKHTTHSPICRQAEETG